jgi:choline dehydrogenase
MILNITTVIAIVAAGLIRAAPTYPNSNCNSHFNPSNGANVRVPGSATFNYVAVGGGTAVLTVAIRLAETGSCSITIIEADGFYQLESGNQSMIPGYAHQLANLDDPDATPVFN